MCQIGLGTLEIDKKKKKTLIIKVSSNVFSFPLAKYFACICFFFLYVKRKKMFMVIKGVLHTSQRYGT